MMFKKESKFNIIIDGQFGSTGKGLISGYLALEEDFDVFASNLSPNAGHTFVDELNNIYITKQLPVGGILNKKSLIYLTAGSIINQNILFEEIEKFDIDPERIFIHPRVAVVEEENIRWEKDLESSVSKIASTQSGTGRALADKILRKAKLAQDNNQLKKFVKEIDLMQLMDDGCSVMMETSQGFDLGINSGLSYPYCTSRDITPMSILSDAQVHPKYLGNVLMCIRTYPIRVGNIYDNQNNIIGYSGPFYPDQKELSWEDLGETPERTTVTKRIRRVAEFSKQQYLRSLNFIRPTHVFLNFVNYIKNEDYAKQLIDFFDMTFVPQYISVGKNINQIIKVKDFNELVHIILGENDRNEHNLFHRY